MTSSESVASGRQKHVVRHLPWTSPLAVACGLAGRNGALCLLSDPTVPASRSFVAAEPDRVAVIDRAAADLFDPLNDPEWGPGSVGLASYDAGARPATGERVAIWPDLMLARYPAWLVFDHDRNVVCAVGWGFDDAEAEAACDLAAGWSEHARAPAPGPPPATALKPEMTPQAYRDAVAEVVGGIAAGDLFQANVAQGWTFTLDTGHDPFDAFVRLAEGGASPYAAFWRLDDRALVSNSPELFITLDIDGRIETRPIKGTRPRGADAASDAASATELVVSEKDRAENLMIVDLMRNDLSRVCVPGSVRVERLFEVETYPTVHHLVSTISGEAAKGAGVAEVLQATFPPGSITGAPKHKAMQVIAELEPPRGAWCGSLFVRDDRGGLTASVLIRTATFERNNGVWTGRALAGAGIVADSDPESERLETEVKIEALRLALTGSRTCAARLARDQQSGQGTAFTWRGRS